MKNLSIVLNVVLFVAVIVLYVLYFSGKSSTSLDAVPLPNDILAASTL